MKFGSFLVSVALGAVAGLLLAPKKGSELRGDLKDKSMKAYDNAKNMTKEDLQNVVNKTIDDVKKTIDEFDMEEFKNTTGDKLNGIKTKLENLASTVQNSEEYSQFKDSVKKVSNDISGRVQEIKTKVQNNDTEGMEKIDEAMDEYGDKLDGIIEDLQS